MEWLTMVGPLALGALVAVVVLKLAGRPNPEALLLQQQLVELRQTLEGMAEGHRAIPETLAEGRALNQAAFNRQLTDLARSVDDRLSATERSVGERLADLRERLGHLSAATERLEEIGTSVADVQDLLRVPQLRGSLGEVWLEELLGQIFPADLFTTQYTFADGERVDAVVRLGGRLVPVDAKFPVSAGERLGAADDREAAKAQQAFRRSVRTRVDEIAGKYIRPTEGTYDFALMYVPAETVYYEMVTAGNDGESLIGYALERRVIPVSPNSFYAYLMVILHGLRGLQVQEHAREILAELEALAGDLERGSRAQDISRKHLEHAMRQQREAGDQLEAARRRVGKMVEPGPALDTETDSSAGPRLA